MSPTLEEQIYQLKQTIAEMESQRAVLGDDVVEAALIPLRQKLTDLEANAESSVEKTPEMPTRQRKLVTLLYMDVVGSTAMTQHLDPEDTLEIMDNSLPRLAAPVEVHRGHVTRYTGDGFKAVFGDPISREDDPEQAIRAGLEILQDALSLAQELQADWGIKDFQVRIGIDTGLAALGGQTEAEDTIMGRVVNLAARIESAAPPGGLLISHNTYRHVRGVFTVEPQEPITAKGFPEPVPVYLVKEIKPRAFRVRTLGVEGVETRMIGRVTELDYLKDALLTAIEEGEGQVITITGEAGVGKSRLLYEFQNWFELLPQIVRLFQGRGRQESQGQPYSLLRDIFAFRFQILGTDSGEEARRKIEAGFGDVLDNDEDSLMRTHILGQLLGFDFSASPHLKGVLNDPEQLRNRALMYLGEYFKTLSQVSPVVIFLEDIHWGDDSSLDVVNHLGERTPHLRLLIVCVTRPTLFERRPYWGEGQTYHTRLELRLLSKRESRQLVTEILKMAENIPTDLRELVVSGSEGNPFYVEELIKMLIEDGVIVPGEESWRVEADRLAQVDVPSTLAGVLQARLDSLPGHERTVLQQASVVGRLFWDRLVAHIQRECGDGGDPQLVLLALTSLRDRELVYRREESAFTGALEYLFKNDVLREVTYESVLNRLRKTYHGLVADWLIANSGDRIGEYSGLIAEHLQLAGRKEQASKYFRQAGNTALASYANHEAENYYRQALEFSPPDSLRADLLSGLGESLRLQGFSDEADTVLRKAIHLYKKMGDSDHMADIFARLSVLIWLSGDHLKAWDLCQEGLKVLKGEPDSPGYAHLLAEGGRTAFFCNVKDQVAPLCKRALEMAEGLGDLEVWAEASNTLALHIADKGDILKSLGILEEVIALTEAEGLLRSAARTHHNLADFMSSSNIDLKAILLHHKRAVEIYRQIGYVEIMMLAMQYLIGSYIESGEIKTLEDKISEFLLGFTAAESMVRELLQNSHPEFFHARGEWIPAIEAIRVDLKRARDIGNLQEISTKNLNLADTLLELNRFSNLDDLSEGESALIENMENYRIIYRIQKSLYLLAIVCARQRHFSRANDWFSRANDITGQYKTDFSKTQCSIVEFELAFVEHNWAEAVIACKKSIEIYKNSGHRWEWARRLIDLGDALIGRNQTGDQERARGVYQESLDMFTEMGAPGYIKVLEERLNNL
jgi:class 3 adenylate cyclase/tetratricopeptide (TPR) repeat protein